MFYDVTVTSQCSLRLELWNDEWINHSMNMKHTAELRHSHEPCGKHPQSGHELQSFRWGIPRIALQMPHKQMLFVHMTRLCTWTRWARTGTPADGAPVPVVAIVIFIADHNKCMLRVEPVDSDRTRRSSCNIGRCSQVTQDELGCKRIK